MVEEAIKLGLIEELKEYQNIRREFTYKKSRFDFRLEGEDICFVEVKGVTLEVDGWGYFPDAPTERGKRHVEELCDAVKEGYRGVILFLIQHPHIKGFTPNNKTDSPFSEALIKAEKAGVEILAYGCDVSENEIIVRRKIPIDLLKTAFV